LLEVIKSAQAARLKYLENMVDISPAIASSKEVKDSGNAASLSNNERDVGALNVMVDDYEKTIIEKALKKHSGDISLVLEELDLPRRTLNAKMNKYGIERKNFR